MVCAAAMVNVMVLVDSRFECVFQYNILYVAVSVIIVGQIDYYTGGIYIVAYMGLVFVY